MSGFSESGVERHRPSGLAEPVTGGALSAQVDNLASSVIVSCVVSSPPPPPPSPAAAACSPPGGELSALTSGPHDNCVDIIDTDKNCTALAKVILLVTLHTYDYFIHNQYVCVCVCVRERERERECVCLCFWSPILY